MQWLSIFSFRYWSLYGFGQSDGPSKATLKLPLVNTQELNHRVDIGFMKMLTELSPDSRYRFHESAYWALIEDIGFMKVPTEPW